MTRPSSLAPTASARATMRGLAAIALVVGMLAACGRREPSTWDRTQSRMTEENRRLVDPCAIPTTAELRRLGVSTEPFEHRITFLSNVCVWQRGNRAVSIEAIQALSDQEQYFDLHDAEPATVHGADRATVAHTYLGPAPEGTWGRSVLARNRRAVVTVGINHRPDGTDPVPILSSWAERTLAEAR